jgi:hypothetical protein
MLLQLTDMMKTDLSIYGVETYRLYDHPLPDTNLRKHAEDAIRATDGTVLFWSREGVESEWVRKEYIFARKVGKPVCLIRFPGVNLPMDWNPEVQWVPFEGVSLTDAVYTTEGVVDRPTVVSRPLYARMISSIEAFARHAAAP